MTNETHQWAKNGGNLAVEIRKVGHLIFNIIELHSRRGKKATALSLVLTMDKRVLYPLSTVEGVLHFNK